MKRLQIWLFLALLSPSLLAASPLSKTELQWAICEPSVSSLFEKLGSKANPPKVSTMSYFDTQALSFYSAGVFLHMNDGSSKTKIDFMRPEDVNFDWLERHHGNCEYDRYGPKRTIRCAVKNDVNEDQSPWSEKQRAFVKHFRNLEIPQTLRRWGPYSEESWAIRDIRLPDDLELAVESIPLADGRSPIIEISARVSTKEADDFYFRIQTYLNDHHIQICPVQSGKFERLLNLY